MSLSQKLMWRALVRMHLPEGRFTDAISKDRIGALMEIGYTPEETVNALMTGNKTILDTADQFLKRARGRT